MSDINGSISMSDSGQTSWQFCATPLSMRMDTDNLYKLSLSRDPRFDGLFFMCVKTTGIYCRPICPARKPNLENCFFVKSAAAAEEAGFRPCQRCRPETAPGSPPWMGTTTTVNKALRLLGNPGEAGPMPDLADKLGVGERHLRRLFNQQLGAPPKSLLQSERLRLARQMLADSSESISAIAFASGFNSIRRFNDAWLKVFGVPPKAWRQEMRARKNTKTGPGTTIVLGYRRPFYWHRMLAFLEKRAIPGVEKIEDGGYFRTVRFGGNSGWLRVKKAPAKDRLEIQLWFEDRQNLLPVIRRIRDMFDLDAVPRVYMKDLLRDPVLKQIISKQRLNRVPGCWDIFELAIRAIIGQQISLKGAQTILGRLVVKCGKETQSAPLNELTHLFPTPAEVLAADISDLGMPKQRLQTIRVMAEAFSGNAGFLGQGLDQAEARKRLLALPGVGDWTAEYILLRGLKFPDAFPASDLGLLKAAGETRPAVLAIRAEAWRPWRGYAALLLWNSLSNGAKK